MATATPARLRPRSPARRVVLTMCWTMALAAAAFWPWTYRYTSVGLDFERVSGADVQCVYWRVRWPGDGSVTVCREEVLRAPDGRGIDGWDPGARFLQPPTPLGARGFWQRQGFWWIVHAKDHGPAPAIVAGSDHAVLVGVPHWLIVCGLGAIAGWATFGRRRVTSSTCPSVRATGN